MRNKKACEPPTSCALLPGVAWRLRAASASAGVRRKEGASPDRATAGLQEAAQRLGEEAEADGDRQEEQKGG